MLYRSKTERVLSPEIFIATVRDSCSDHILTAVLPKSWNSFLSIPVFLNALFHDPRKSFIWSLPGSLGPLRFKNFFQFGIQINCSAFIIFCRPHFETPDSIKPTFENCQEAETPSGKYQHYCLSGQQTFN